jgi:glycosyltransferase involved in cell wall biosynthesis
VSRLRSLVVVHEPPLTDGRASGRCVIAMVRGLQAHGVEVQVLAARQSFALPGDPPADLGVEVVDVAPEPGGWAMRARRLRRPVGELSRSAFAERVREAARAVDVLHLEEVDTAWLSEGVDRPSVVRLQYLVRWDRGLGGPWTRSFRHVLEFELAERAAIRSHNAFIPASPRVADEIRRRRPGATVQLVPLCLDPADYPPAVLDGPPTAGIIGTAGWPITAAAMRRLVHDVWPEVRRLAPEARLLVAGRGTDAVGLEGPGVEVLGEVPSAVDFLRSLSVLLYPITRGSGVKVKTLEALACGVPVVTTAFGAEGIDGGEGVVVGAETRVQARAAASILRDAGERRERGAAGRAAFEARYSPLPATAPLVELYRRLAERGDRPRISS